MENARGSDSRHRSGVAPVSFAQPSCTQFSDVSLCEPAVVVHMPVMLRDQPSNDLESLLFEPRPGRSSHEPPSKSESRVQVMQQRLMGANTHNGVAASRDNDSPQADCCAALHAYTSPVRTRGTPSSGSTTSTSSASRRPSLGSQYGPTSSYVRWSEDDSDPASSPCEHTCCKGMSWCDIVKLSLCWPCLGCLWCVQVCQTHCCESDEEGCMVSPSRRRSRTNQAAILQQMEMETRETVLTKACHDGNVSQVAELLQHEDPNKANRMGDTPLIIASSNGRADLVRQLLDSGANANGRDVQGYTVLMRAAESGSVDVTAELLEAGADATAKVGDGATALYMAARAGRSRVMDELIKHLVDERQFTFIDAVLRSSLRKARRMGLEDLSLRLVRAGANLNGQDRAGITPLMLAAQQGLTQIVREMLQLGASVSMVSRHDGDTALTLACSHAHQFKRYYQITVQYLLNAGANVHHRTADFKLTPLAYAVHAGNHIIVSKLLVAGADPNHMDGEGLTPLVRALGSMDQSQTVSNRARLAVALIGGGADPNMADGIGRSPLHVVIDRAHAVPESQLLVMLLLQAGADRHRTNVIGKSAVDFDSELSTHHQILQSHIPSLKLMAAAEVRRHLHRPFTASIAGLGLRDDRLKPFLKEGFLDGLVPALEAAEFAAQQSTDRNSALLGDSVLEII